MSELVKYVLLSYDQVPEPSFFKKPVPSGILNDVWALNIGSDSEVKYPLKSGGVYVNSPVVLSYPKWPSPEAGGFGSTLKLFKEIPELLTNWLKSRRNVAPSSLLKVTLYVLLSYVAETVLVSIPPTPLVNDFHWLPSYPKKSEPSHWIVPAILFVVLDNLKLLKNTSSVTQRFKTCLALCGDKSSLGPDPAKYLPRMVCDGVPLLPVLVVAVVAVFVPVLPLNRKVISTPF